MNPISKRILSILLVVVMCLTMLPATALAAEGTTAKITGLYITIDGVEYNNGNTSAETPATIYSDSTVTVTVYGENFANLPESGNKTNGFTYFGSNFKRLDKADSAWSIDTASNTATLTASHNILAKATAASELKYTNDSWSTDLGSGVYVIYNEGTKPTDTPAKITGMSITIDGVEYTNLNTSETNPAVITPNSTVQVKVYGTILNNATSDNYARYCPKGGSALTKSGWTIAGDGTSATLSTTYTAPSDYESATEAYELLYGNSGSDATTFVGSGVWIIYRDPAVTAEITGVSIMVGGTTYTEGTVTLTPDSGDVTIIVSGTNLQNRTNDNRVYLRTAFSVLMGSYYAWSVNDTGTEASRTYSVSTFANQTTAHEIGYCNDGSTNYIGTGIYLTYDDGTGGEEDTTPAEITGVTITVDGETYSSGNVTITPTSTVVYTVSGTNFANVSNDNIVMYAMGCSDSLTYDLWTIDTEANTATWDLSDYISWFKDCNHFPVLYSNDGVQNWTETGIYLTYDDGIDNAEITGVTITVDGKTYTEGNVTITPTSTVIITVTGTNFANVSDDNLLMYAPGYADSLNRVWFTIDAEANTATWDASEDIDLFAICDNSEVMYSNDGGSNWNGTGIYLTYNDGTGESELISVDITWGTMSFTYTDGEWQPESHTYADGKWTPDTDGGNVITVQNNGNVAVNVTFTYNETVTEVEGSFTDESGNAITSPFALAVEEEKKIKLILNGKPSSTFEDTQLGTVTVKITLPEQQDP